MEQQHKSFLAEIRRRRIILNDMSPDVRIAAVSGALMLALALLLEIAHNHLGHDIYVGFLTGEGASAIMPRGSVIAWVVGEWMLFTLTFAGVLRLRRALIGIAIITAVFSCAVWFTRPVHDSWTILAAPALLLLSLPMVRRGWLNEHGILAVAALAASLPIATIIVLYNTLHDTSLPSILFIFGLVAAVIGLWMAGTDIAEIVQVGAEELTHRLMPIRYTGTRALLFAAAGLLANLGAAWFVLRSGGWLHVIDLHHELVSLVTAAAAAMLLLALLAVGRKLDVSPHLNYASLLLYAGLFLAVFLTLALNSALGPYLHGSMAYWDIDLDAAVDRIANHIFPLLALLLFVLFLVFGKRSVKAFRALGFAMCGGVVACAFYNRYGDPNLLLGHAAVAGSVALLITVLSVRRLRPHWKQICRLLGIANLSFAALQIASYIFDAGPGKVEGQAVLSAAIVAIALTWDIVTSGDLTNQRSAGMPRFARVAFFSSYIITVGLLFMLTQTGIIFYLGHMADHFSSEEYVGNGIILFGGPMIFYIFAVQLRGVLNHVPAEAAPPQSDLDPPPLPADPL